MKEYIHGHQYSWKGFTFIPQLMGNIISGELKPPYWRADIDIVICNMKQEQEYREAKLKAMIDTGSVGTAIKPHILAELNLQKTGKWVEQLIFSENRKVKRDVFQAAFKSPPVLDKWLIFEVVELDSMYEDVDVVFGCHSLQVFKFTYNGQANLFELELLIDPNTIH